MAACADSKMYSTASEFMECSFIDSTNGIAILTDKIHSSILACYSTFNGTIKNRS